MRGSIQMLSAGLLATLVCGGVSVVHAQDKVPPAERSRGRAALATQEEVQQLRNEVTRQRQTIDELKAVVERLVAAGEQSALAAEQAHTTALQAKTTAGAAQDAALRAQSAAGQAEQVAEQNRASLLDTKTSFQRDQGTLEQKLEARAMQAGWNGEHFFLKSSDGQFLLQPYGYFQLDYRAYDGTSTPPNTFALRRGRFGFQGTLGKHYEFAFLVDSADTNSTLLRDAYINVKPVSELQFQFGLFKEPFAQELLASAANLEFVERALTSLLYPSPSTFRSPGMAVHGALFGGVMQYWAGAVNGRGTLNLNTTSTPEEVTRLRFSPWHNTTNEWLKGFAFGGAFAYGRSQSGTANNSFSALLPDRTFTFFKVDPISGPVLRANGDFTWMKGPLAVRGEYDQLNQFRRGLGVGSTDLPGVVGKGYYVTASYLLTGEERPENGQPKPRHPFLSEEHGMGAWELKLRYSDLQASDGTQKNRVDEFSSGINWYPSNLLRFMIDFNVERLREPVASPVPLTRQTFMSVLQRVQFRF